MNINPLGTKPKIDPAQASRIKDWVQRTFALSADDAVLVTELQCTEEGCPPLETVIAILAEPGKPRPFKLHKPMADVTATDIQTLRHASDHEH
jgi:hypothetical protein